MLKNTGMLNKNVDLKPYNTFGISAKANYFAAFDSINSLDDLIKNNQNKPITILGGGSNVLFTKDYEGLILRNEIIGISVEKETEDFVYIKTGAGENWHEFVLYCIDNDWGGIENLSLIPGSVGASPMQNIGAYGIEIKDVFHSLEAYEVETGKTRSFSHQECEFGYRESAFKKSLKGKYIITSVTYKLTKKHQINTNYGAIEEQLKQMAISVPTIKDISNAVIAIRQSKLPNPKEIGNAGSFFKNPVVDISILKKIQEKYENVPHYYMSDTSAKLPAGWLIDQAGWKGKRFGNYGVHVKQALVLVNYDNATGTEIYDLSQKILNDIQNKFGILLEREVNII